MSVTKSQELEDLQEFGRLTQSTWGPLWPQHFKFWHFPIWTVSNTFRFELFLTLSNLSYFWHFPIWAISNTFQFDQFLKLSYPDSFQSEELLTQPNLE